MTRPKVGEMWLEPHSNLYYMVLQTEANDVIFTYLNGNLSGRKDKVAYAHFFFCRKIDK